jgi:hypothetical protein
LKRLFLSLAAALVFSGCATLVEVLCPPSPSPAPPTTTTTTTPPDPDPTPIPTPYCPPIAARNGDFSEHAPSPPTLVEVVDAAVAFVMDHPVNLVVYDYEHIQNTEENRERFWREVQDALCAFGYRSVVGDLDKPLGQRDQIEVFRKDEDPTVDVTEGYKLLNFGGGGVYRGDNIRGRYQGALLFRPGSGGVSCTNPRPGPLSQVDVKVHVIGANFITIDSTPKVGPDAEYCGRWWTDGRRYCPPRPEGHAEREACDVAVFGIGPTHRPGPRWRWNGGDVFNTEEDERGVHVAENPFQLRVRHGRFGTAEACGTNGVCGEVRIK